MDDEVGELPIAAFVERGVLHVMCMRDTQYAVLITSGVTRAQSWLEISSCIRTSFEPMLIDRDS